MEQVELDERGRITLPAQLRKKMHIEKKLVIIQVGDHIKLIPVPAEPFKTLQGALEIKKTFKQLREEATKQLQEETTHAAP